MADLAQLDLKTKGAEARLRALLNDTVEMYQGVRSGHRLAFAVWFGKSAGSSDQNLLELFPSPQSSEIISTRFSLQWRSGSESPPFVNLYATSVNHFSKLLDSNADEVKAFLENPEVLYFDKQLLTERILRAFNVITEPPGLLKGWYVTAEHFQETPSLRALLSVYSGFRPQIGLVKVSESADFQNCRGLLQVEVGQRWIPLSLKALAVHTFFNDLQDGRSGYFLFEGGSLYQLLKFEVKTAPEYSTRVLEQLPDARYPEVYLRAVRPAEQPAA